MKTLSAASTLTLIVLCLAVAAPIQAQLDGPSARGSFRFLLDDEQLKTLEFDVISDPRGRAAGQVILTDRARIADHDDPEDPRFPDAPPEFAIRAEIDSLTVERNRALMNGTVVESTHRTYLGSHVQLVLEDSGDNRREPDRLMWTFCRPQRGGWIPSDAERDDDDGAFLSWWATDAERDDDVGIPSPSLLPGELRSCRVLPLSVYSLTDPLKWEGDIVVQPATRGIR